MPLSKNLKKRNKHYILLKEHTTFRIGGPAGLFFRPKDIPELGRLIEDLSSKKQKILVLGAGSNILASDSGVSAAVIKLGSPDFCKIENDRGAVDTGAGIPLAGLLSYCRIKGLSGLEFMAGIPGTVGGALAMNAGISLDGRKMAIGDLVDSVRVMDYNGRLKTLGRSKLKFSYRASNLDKYIILGARLKLAVSDKKKVAKNISGYLARRRSTQDYSRPNAGCVFKNPAGDSAGRMIDSCGLKGRKSGRARVSLRHANFILNCGNATCRDVLALMNLIKKEVNKKYGIMLEPEIKIWE